MQHQQQQLEDSQEQPYDNEDEIKPNRRGVFVLPLLQCLSTCLFVVWLEFTVGWTWLGYSALDSPDLVSLVVQEQLCRSKDGGQAYNNSGCPRSDACPLPLQLHHSEAGSGPSYQLEQNSVHILRGGSFRITAQVACHTNASWFPNIESAIQLPSGRYFRCSKSSSEYQFCSFYELAKLPTGGSVSFHSKCTVACAPHMTSMAIERI